MAVRMKEERAIPGPKGQLILGNLRAVLPDKLGFLKRHAQIHGDVFRFHLGPTRFVVVNDLQMIRTILIDDADRYVKSALTRDIFGRVMGNGLMVSEGEFHRRQRRLMQPAFDPRRVSSYEAVVQRHAETVVASWRAGDLVDVDAEMLRITMGIAGEVLFGTNVGPEVERLTSAIQTLQAAGSELYNSGFIPPAWVPSRKNRQLARAVAEVERVLGQVIEERRRGGSDQRDLLSMLLLASDDEGKMSAKQVGDEARTLFTSGVETTANSLSWTFYHLARETNVRERLERELGELPGGAGDARSYAYMIVKEVLRVSCPIWAFNRSPLKPELVGGYALEPKDVVMVSPYLLHRDPRHFTDPERFDPERFSETREGQIPRLAYLPFGAGPRVCIGTRLALLEIATVVSVVSRRFRLELISDEPVEPEPLISVRPKGGLKLRVERRPASA